MGPVWFQIEVCTTREINRVKKHKANKTTMVWCSAIKHNRGMMHFPLCFPVTLIPISQMIVQVISGSDSTYILGAAVTMLSTTWSVRKPASFIRFSHNPTPQKSLGLHGAESNLWQCMTIPWFKITETSTWRQQLWVSRVFPHSFEALPAAHMLLLPSCDQRYAILKIFSRCLALLINTPVSWSIWSTNIETYARNLFHSAEVDI